MALIAEKQIKEILKIKKVNNRLHIIVQFHNDIILEIPLKQCEKKVVEKVRYNWRVNKIERLLKNLKEEDDTNKDSEY